MAQCSVMTQTQEGCTRTCQVCLVTMACCPSTQAVSILQTAGCILFKMPLSSPCLQDREYFFLSRPSMEVLDISIEISLPQPLLSWVIWPGLSYSVFSELLAGLDLDSYFHILPENPGDSSHRGSFLAQKSQQSLSFGTQ